MVEIVEKICDSCEKSFLPSSDHKDCPKCRHAKRPTHPCVDCGSPVKPSIIRCRKCASTGAHNGRWKNGEIKHKRGYIMVRVPWHPRAVANGGYVFQHILVMEKKLGRFLIEKETVHHKYGIKDDNHPDHLELWSGSHPAGCRVEDLVEFSKETLKKYAPELLKHVPMSCLYTNYLSLVP